MTGAVIDEAAVAGRRAEDDTAETRLTIGATQGCERLEQRVTRYATGRSRSRAAASSSAFGLTEMVAFKRSS